MTTVARALTPARVFGAAFLLPPAAVGVALFTQHGLGMQPCPWCVLQRAIFLAIALAALLGLVVRAQAARRVSAGLVLVLAGCGIAAALWQHFVAAASHSCTMSLADRIVREIGLDELAPQVFIAYASCADGSVSLLGVPYEFYSLALFCALAAAAVWLLRKS